MSQAYATVSEADTYFSERLHSTVWDNASVADQTKALLQATRDIDCLNFKGYKATVATLLSGVYDVSLVDPATIRAAEAAQELEFPRGTDTVVPPIIQRACFEIAYALLDGVDPDTELENLAVVSQGYAGVRTTYNRIQQPIEHLVAGIASATAWRMLKPFIRDGQAIKTSRV
ncbi:MAG: hypothetical protein WC657_06525, partial [Candidatus Paceibacterota bacterium]|jgi:hypothetical protein